MNECFNHGLDSKPPELSQSKNILKTYFEYSAVTLSTRAGRGVRRDDLGASLGLGL